MMLYRPCNMRATAFPEHHSLICNYAQSAFLLSSAVTARRNSPLHQSQVHLPLCCAYFSYCKTLPRWPTMAAIIVSFLLIVAIGALGTSSTARALSTGTGARAGMHAVQRNEAVQLELFVMSKCPDALRCEMRMDEVLKRVHNLSVVKLHYIGQTDGNTTTCMHGKLECDGNKQQLCTQRYTPSQSNYAHFWPFIMCLSDKFRIVGRPQLFSHCLRAAGYESTPALAMIESCATSSEGEGLLAASMTHTKKRGVSKSCTIHINGLQRCIMDSGQWYDCPGGSEAEDFQRSICEAYHTITGIWPEQECGAGLQLEAAKAEAVL